MTALLNPQQRRMLISASVVPHALGGVGWGGGELGGGETDEGRGLLLDNTLQQFTHGVTARPPHVAIPPFHRWSWWPVKAIHRTSSLSCCQTIFINRS